MRLSILASILLGCASTNAYSIPSIMKRDIPSPNHHTMRGNLTSIASWSLAALSYSAIQSSSKPELKYLCENFNNLASRYTTAFPEPAGDILYFGREAICAASKSPSDNASPPGRPYDNLWYMKSYIAGSFVIQGYYGDKNNGAYLAQMCWFLESSLLRGVWAPCEDTEESGVDVESSFCAASGYYQKDVYFQYTKEEQGPEVVQQGNVLVSRLMGALVRVLVKSEEQVEYLCGNFGKYAEGIRSLGLVDGIVKEEVCGKKEVVELEVAKRGLFDAWTELFTFQLLKGGNDKGYHAYLCQTLKKDSLAKVGLGGEKVLAEVCKAAKEL